MRAVVLVLACLFPSVAEAELSSRVDEPQQQGKALASVPVPCLRDGRDQRVVVTWWIENKVTGERRSVGSREIRQRC